MRQDFLQNFVWAEWIIYKEPILSKLVIDGELLACIAELYPGFRDTIGYEVRYRCPMQFTDVVT